MKPFTIPFVVLSLLLSIFTSAQYSEVDDARCIKTITSAQTRTSVKTITETVSRCTKTVPVTVSAPSTTKPFPTSSPPCLSQFYIQFRDTGYGFINPSSFNLQYATLHAPNSSSSLPNDLIFSPTPSLRSATLFNLDTQGLLFANYTFPSSSSSNPQQATTTPTTVYGNAIRPSDPSPVFFNAAAVVFDPNGGRGVLQCEIYAPCGQDEQLRCFVVDNKRFFDVSLGAEDYPPGSGEGPEGVEMSSTPYLPREEGLFIVGRRCVGR